MSLTPHYDCVTTTWVLIAVDRQYQVRMRSGRLPRQLMFIWMAGTRRERPPPQKNIDQRLFGCSIDLTLTRARAGERSGKKAMDQKHRGIGGALVATRCGRVAVRLLNLRTVFIQICLFKFSPSSRSAAALRDRLRTLRRRQSTRRLRPPPQPWSSSPLSPRVHRRRLPPPGLRRP